MSDRPRIRAYIIRKAHTAKPDRRFRLNTRSRRVPDDKAATPEEIQAAIEALAPAELLRLREFAGWRVAGLGRKALGQNHDDLLGEAITRTLAGDRRWNKLSVNFAGHLMGVMRSISTHWKEQFDSDEPHLESELTHVSPEGEVWNPLMRVDSAAPNPERILDARQQVEEIERLFAEDTVASLIIQGLREGMSGPDLRADLELSQTEYDTAMKRIRRKVRVIA